MPKKTFSATASTASSPNYDGVKLNDFCAYMPQPNSFFFMPCRELWPGSNIDRRLPRVPVLTKAGQPKRDKNGKVITIPATKWITDNCSVEQATWAPGQPMLIPNRLYTKGGIIDHPTGSTKRVTSANSTASSSTSINCVGVIITTNHKTDGIYLRADDRRHFVVWSDYKKEEFTPEYWNELWSYYRDGGFEHVAAYLTELDISDFDPKAPPPQTPAFWEIVHAHRPLENNELADVLDTLGKPDPTDPQRIIWPDAVTIPILIAAATGTVAEWMSSPKGRQAIRYRLDDLEYIALKNPATKDGMWKVSGARQAVYVKAVLSPAERLDAARKL